MAKYQHQRSGGESEALRCVAQHGIADNARAINSVSISVGMRSVSAKAWRQHQ